MTLISFHTIFSTAHFCVLSNGKDEKLPASVWLEGSFLPEKMKVLISIDFTKFTTLKKFSLFQYAANGANGPTGPNATPTNAVGA